VIIITLPDSCTCPRGPVCAPCWDAMTGTADFAAPHGESCEAIVRAGCEADYEPTPSQFCSRYGCGEIVPDDQLVYDEQPYTDYDGTLQFAGDGRPYHAQCLISAEGSR
jgi:hypothetical protein